MRFSSQDERQSHADELQRTEETNARSELHPSIEYNVDEEYFRSEELPTPPRRNGSGKPSRGGKQSAAIVAILFSFTAAVGVIPLLPSASVSLKNKRIGFDSFYGELRFERASDKNFHLVLSDAQGERYDELLIEKGVKSLSYSYPYLRPEEEYLLTVYDGKGKKYLSYPFETDSLVTLTETDDPQKLAFSFHAEFPAYSDFRLELFDIKGKDFSSNILLDPLATNYLYLDGLYENEYSLIVTFFREDEEISHDKWVSLGTLSPLTYEVSATEGVLTFNHQSGDLTPYTNLEVRLSAVYDTQSYVLSSENILHTDGGLSVTLPADLQSGRYSISLWGEFENTEMQFYNEIWNSETSIDL